MNGVKKPAVWISPNPKQLSQMGRQKLGVHPWWTEIAAATAAC